MLLFVPIFLIAGILLVIVGRKAKRDARDALLWPTVEGTLQRCEVVEKPGIQVNDVSTWHLQVEYSYVVRGTTYRSTRYAFAYGDGRDDKEHRAVVAELTRAPHVTVHYDPARPSEAVLSTAVQTNLTKLGYAGLVMAVISAVIAMASR